LKTAACRSCCDPTLISTTAVVVPLVSSRAAPLARRDPADLALAAAAQGAFRIRPSDPGSLDALRPPRGRDRFGRSLASFGPIVAAGYSPYGKKFDDKVLAILQEKKP